MAWLTVAAKVTGHDLCIIKRNVAADSGHSEADSVFWTDGLQGKRTHIKRVAFFQKDGVAECISIHAGAARNPR